MGFSGPVMNSGALKIGALCFLLFLLPLALGGSQKEGPKEESSAERSFGSLEKSFLLPGWGQMAEKRYVEAAVFLGAEIFCLAKILSHNHRGSTYYSFYKEADNAADAVKYERADRKI